jgi:hypothetical protein
VRRAEEPRKVLAEAQVVHAVPELVEHRVRAVVRLHRVRENPHIAAAVDVDAERVLVLSFAGVEVAPREDPLDLEPDPLERPLCERDDVLVGEERVEVDGTVRRRLLEERVRVVPRPKLRDRAAETRGEAPVESGFPARERLRGDAVRLRERLDELLLIELVRGERQREPVAIPERTRALVPKPGELANVGRDLRADGLGGLPRLTPFIRIVTPAQDPLDLGVLDLGAADDTAMT